MQDTIQFADLDCDLNDRRWRIVSISDLIVVRVIDVQSLVEGAFLGRSKT